MTYETIEELTETLGGLYDIDAIEFDYRNNNFDLTYPEVQEYYMPQIVANSVINGQHKQAKSQFSKYGLTCGDLDGFLEPEDIYKFSEL